MWNAVRDHHRRFHFSTEIQKMRARENVMKQLERLMKILSLESICRPIHEWGKCFVCGFYKYKYKEETFKSFFSENFFVLAKED